MRLKPGALGMLGKHFITKLYTYPLSCSFMNALGKKIPFTLHTKFRTQIIIPHEKVLWLQLSLC